MLPLLLEWSWKEGSLAPYGLEKGVSSVVEAGCKGGIFFVFKLEMLSTVYTD